MNGDEIQALIDGYIAWVKRGFSVVADQDVYTLNTPFLDRHNDQLQVYIVRRDNRLVISDDGYILADLEQSGLDIDTPKRKDILQATINGLGVQLHQGSLVVEGNPNNFPQQLHSLVQAMLAVNDMFLMAQSRVLTLFREDVRAYLDEHAVRYTERVKLSGKSGLDQPIEFLIPKSPHRPERFLHAISNPQRDAVSNYLFVVGDVRQSRHTDFEAYAVLNDRDHEVPRDLLGALESYNVHGVLWSRRDQYVDALAS